MHVHASKQDFGNGALAHKVRRTRLESLGHAVAIFTAREENNRKVVQRMALANTEADIEAVHVRHIDIQKNEIHGVVLQELKSILARIATGNIVAHLGQEVFRFLDNFLVVIDYQNFFFDHKPPPDKRVTTLK